MVRAISAYLCFVDVDRTAAVPELGCGPGSALELLNWAGFANTEEIKLGKRPRIFKHGQQKRDFVYVNDIISEIMRAADAKSSGIYNPGSGEARSFNELCRCLELLPRH